MGDILTFTRTASRYRKIALKRSDRGDNVGALSALFSAKSVSDDYSVYADIADVYADMDLLERSCQYWLYYLDKAPASKASVAYEELLINYVSMDNPYLAGYYYHLMLSTKTPFSDENIEKEVYQFLSEEADERSGYHMAYPYAKADYSQELKMARRAFAMGEFSFASQFYEHIPTECLDDENYCDYVVSLMCEKRYKDAVNVCSEFLKNDPENVLVCCVLSSVYYAMKNKDKSAYYYSRAKANDDGGVEHAYRLIACAMEQGDHKTVRSCLQQILKERPHDPMMLFFDGINGLNIGDVEHAEESFKSAHAICPDDFIFTYYASNVASENGVAELTKNLPLKYAKELPASVERKYKTTVRNLMKGEAAKKLDYAKYADLVNWGIKYADDDTARRCVFIAAFCLGDEASRVLTDALLDLEVSDYCKRTIVYSLAASGRSGNYNFTVSDALSPFKVKEIIGKDDEVTEAVTAAYSIALSRFVFVGLKDTEKLADGANKALGEYSELISKEGYLPEELAVIVTLLSGIQGLDEVKEVCDFFEVAPVRLHKFLDAEQK